MAKYIIRKETREKVEVEAEPVTLTGWEDFQFILHKNAAPNQLLSNKESVESYVVSEVTIGCRVGLGDTPEDAVNTALLNLGISGITHAKMKKVIEKQTGLLKAYDAKHEQAD